MNKKTITTVTVMNEKNPMLGIAGIAENKLDKDKLKNFLDFYDYINDHKLGTRKVVNRWG